MLTREKSKRKPPRKTAQNSENPDGQMRSSPLLCRRQFQLNKPREREREVLVREWKGLVCYRRTTRKTLTKNLQEKIIVVTNGVTVGTVRNLKSIAAVTYGPLND